MNWQAVFPILREKSTLAGLTGLGVVIASRFGFHVDDMVMQEIVLAAISIVAIMTRPREPKYVGSYNRRRGDPAGVIGPEHDQFANKKAQDRKTGAGGGDSEDRERGSGI